MSRDSPQDLPPPLQEAIKEREGTANEDAPSLEELWTLLDSAKPPSSALPDASDTWADVRRNLDSDAESPDPNVRSSKPPPRRPSRSRARHWVGWRWTVAAVVLLIAVVGAWLWQRPVAVTAAPGTTVTRTLPEGSVVELNGGSRLTYSRTMSTFAFLEDQRRVVRLQGEAYFEVRSADRSFVVHTQTARVEVVGTAFAVQTDPDGTGTHVALAEGAVRVWSPAAPERTAILRPGEGIWVGKEGPVSPPSDTSIRRVTAWRRGGFAITAQPLPAVVRALERQFGTPIRLSPNLSPEVTSSPLTLYYSRDVDVETVLHDISLARGLSYRPTAQGYVIAPSDRTWLPTGSEK